MSADATAPAGSSAEELTALLLPDVFKALADPNRVTLLARLATACGPQTVTALSGCCGVHLSGVSRHLKVLLDAGLVEAERDGREVRYRLDCLALSGALREMAEAFERCHEACA